MQKTVMPKITLVLSAAFLFICMCTAACDMGRKPDAPEKEPDVSKTKPVTPEKKPNILLIIGDDFGVVIKNQNRSHTGTDFICFATPRLQHGIYVREVDLAEHRMIG